MCCTTNGSYEAAHPAPERWQTWGRNNTHQCPIGFYFTSYTHGRYFIHRRVWRCTIDPAHQLESRRYELAIGLLLGGLQAEQTSIRILHYVEQKNYDTLHLGLLSCDGSFKQVTWRNLVMQVKPGQTTVWLVDFYRTCWPDVSRWLYTSDMFDEYVGEGKSVLQVDWLWENL